MAFSDIRLASLPPGGNRHHYLQGRDYSVRASMAYWSDEFQVHLRTSPHISTYLHTSPHISMHLPPSVAFSDLLWSDEFQASPEAARAAAPALTDTCLKVRMHLRASPAFHGLL